MSDALHWALAQSAQDQFLRSVSDNTRSSVDGLVVLQIAIGAVVLLLSAVAARRYYEHWKNPPKVTIKNGFKLQREMARTLSLSSKEMRKLEFHAGRLGVENPLTLLLCPSLLEHEMESKVRRAQGELQESEDEPKQTDAVHELKQAEAPTPQPAEESL